MKNQKHFEGFCVVAGENYAQGSSREHAALAPKFLGQKFTIAKSYARIGWQNLINFGMIPFEFQNPSDWDKLEQGDILRLEGLLTSVEYQLPVKAKIVGKNIDIPLTFNLSERQKEIILNGGIINYMKKPGAISIH